VINNDSCMVMGAGTEYLPKEANERFLKSLERSQWFDAAEWAVYQGRLLERLVRHAFLQSDYYSNALSVLFDGNGQIDWERWSDVPILTREKAQADPEALKVRSVPELLGNASTHRTSGSTGRVFEFLTDDLAGVASKCLADRFNQWHGVDTKLSNALIKSHFVKGIYPYPDGGLTRGWDSRHPDSYFHQLNIGCPVDQQAEWLERKRPDYVTTYPNNMLEIGRTMGAQRTRDLNLRAYFSYGEAFDEEMRTEIEEMFQAPMLDRYGATEVGQVSAQCPASKMQHVAMENVYFELLDENDLPVKPGERGRVVATPFYNYSMPFIRYEVGDYAVLAESPCTCGRSMPLIERIIGRTRSIFRFADGSSRWPDTKPSEIKEFLPHKKLQVVQTAIDHLEVRIVAQSDDQVEDIEGLTVYFRDRLHESLHISVRRMDDIPRSPSGKYFDFYSDISR